MCPPPYCHLYSIENTHISGRHFQQRPLGGAAKLFSIPLPHSRLSLFLNCLPSVTRSVTSPVILPCVCKSWLFVLKCVNLVEVCCLPLPPPLKKNTLWWRVCSFWVLPDFSFPCASPIRRAASIRSSIRLTSIHPSDDNSGDQDWNHQSGLLEEAMVLRRAVVLCRRCSGWRR